MDPSLATPNYLGTSVLRTLALLGTKTSSKKAKSSARCAGTGIYRFVVRRNPLPQTCHRLSNAPWLCADQASVTPDELLDPFQPSTTASCCTRPRYRTVWYREVKYAEPSFVCSQWLNSCPPSSPVSSNVLRSTPVCGPRRQAWFGTAWSCLSR